VRRVGLVCQGLDAGGQLGEREWFREVVVGPQSEPGDPLGDCGGGGEHQDPGVDAGVHEGRADLVAGDDRQVAVQHHDVVVVDRQPLERGVAVVGHVHGHRLSAQPLGDGVGQQPFVLDNQDAHRPILPGRGVITGAIKWGDAISAFGQVGRLRGHTPWPPP